MAEYVEYEKKERRKIGEVFNVGRYTFSKTEIRHLLFSFFLIMITLIVMNSKSSMTFSLADLKNIDFITILGYMVAVGSGFILHELAHKIMAQYYNFQSEFRGDFQTSLIILFIALFSPILILAPGAVWVIGKFITLKQNGFISIVGPITNLLIAIFCFFLILIFPFQSVALEILYLTIKVNLILGIFNMLPFWVLDGAKIVKWNQIAYFSLVFLLVFFYIIVFVLKYINLIFFLLFLILFFGFIFYLIKEFKN